MCECPICGQDAYGPVEHGLGKELRTPEFFAHVHRGRVYFHPMVWTESAPRDLKV